MDKENLIKEAFTKGADTKQAAIHANCSLQEVLDWLAIGDNLLLVELLKETPKWNAKKAVVSALEDPKTAQWYLERRDPDFKPKGQTDVTVDPKMPLILNIGETLRGIAEGLGSRPAEPLEVIDGEAV